MRAPSKMIYDGLTIQYFLDFFNRVRFWVKFKRFNVFVFVEVLKWYLVFGIWNLVGLEQLVGVPP